MPTQTRSRHLTRLGLRGVVALGIALLLGGCVVYPGGGPGYYGPHYYYGGGYGYYHGWR